MERSSGKTSIHQRATIIKKAAIILIGIVLQSEVQGDLFSDQEYNKNQHALMSKVDEINKRYGKQTALFAATGIEQSWQMKRPFLTQRFTTQWDELMEVTT